MSELALPTGVSDTMWQPSSKVLIFYVTFNGGFVVVKCSFRFTFVFHMKFLTSICFKSGQLKLESQRLLHKTILLLFPFLFCTSQSPMFHIGFLWADPVGQWLIQRYQIETLSVSLCVLRLTINQIVYHTSVFNQQ